MTDLLFSRLLLHVAAVMICSPLLVISQSARLDSIKTNAAEYKSFGFNASSISGLGLSFRTHLAGPSLVQFTGGLLVSGNSTSYSVGLEYQYEISRRSDLRYYIAFGAGIYNSSTSSTATAGLGGLDLNCLCSVSKSLKTWA
ncbi:MAG: hypothetical protein HY562_02005 [Ignavibacteriales bacterium]|nr:hypothetical protein [Ignavibacteriales bacterium]